MGFRYLEKDIDDIVKSKPLAIEKALKILRIKIDLYNDKVRNENNLYQEFREDQQEYGGAGPGISEDGIAQDDAVDRLVKEKEVDKVKSEKNIAAKRAARSNMKIQI